MSDSTARPNGKPKPKSVDKPVESPPKEWTITSKLGLVAALLVALTGVLSQIEPAVEAAESACNAFGLCGRTPTPLNCSDYSKLSKEEIEACQQL